MTSDPTLRPEKLPEDSDRALRPQVLEEFIGQHDARANLRVFIPDPDGAESYPIISFSWLLLKERNADPAKAAALKRFVNWGLSEGQGLSSELGYIRLPTNVAELGKAVLTRVQ